MYCDGSLFGIAYSACLGFVINTTGQSPCRLSTNDNSPWSIAARRKLNIHNIISTLFLTLYFARISYTRLSFQSPSSSSRKPAFCRVYILVTNPPSWCRCPHMYTRPSGYCPIMFRMPPEPGVRIHDVGKWPNL